MLQMRNTRLYKSLFENLAPGAAVQEEGVALSYVKVNGETFVEPGVDGGRFAGIAIARNVPPAVVPLVEEGVIGSDGKGKLTRAPIAGQLLVTVAGVVFDVVGAAPQAGEVKVSGADYEFNTADAGHKATFQYMYAPTVSEARTLVGDAPYGGLAANALGTVGVVKQGSVATSFFDASADWSNTTYAKLANGGKFVPATANTGIVGVVVKNSPSVGNPFLVLELNVG